MATQVVFRAGQGAGCVGDRVLPPIELTVTDDEGVRPTAWVRVETIDGTPQVREVRLSSVTGGDEVRAADLRALRLDDLLELATGAAGLVVTLDVGEVVTAEGPGDERTTVRQVREARRRARRKVTDELLREVAEVYGDNSEGAPVQAVSEHFDVALRTATWYVRQARDAGYLAKRGSE